MLPQWEIQRLEIPITVKTTAYSDADVVGGALSCDVKQFAGGGRIHSLLLVDDAAQSEPFYLYVFRDTPSTIADDAAFAPTEADGLVYLGRILIEAADYVTWGSEKIAPVTGKDADTSDYIYFDSLPDGKLYFYLVANSSTPDYADANDLTLYITVLGA